jgi:hypothetical protein
MLEAARLDGLDLVSLPLEYVQYIYIRNSKEHLDVTNYTPIVSVSILWANS